MGLRTSCVGCPGGCDANDARAICVDENCLFDGAEADRTVRTSDVVRAECVVAVLDSRYLRHALCEVVYKNRRRRRVEAAGPYMAGKVVVDVRIEVGK